MEGKNGINDQKPGNFDKKYYPKKLSNYIWHFFSEKHQDFISYEDARRTPAGFCEEEKLEKLIETEIYLSLCLPTYQTLDQKSENQLSRRNKYFRNLFYEWRFTKEPELIPEIKFIRLPYRIYEEILEIIINYNLEKIQDLLLETLALTQKNYVRHISPWLNEENQELIKTAKRESEKVFQLLKRTNSNPEDLKERIKGNRVVSINFLFDDGTSIKIDHKWLAMEFVDHFRQHYEDYPDYDSAGKIRKYSKRFNFIEKKNQFKYLLAIGYYRLFSENDFFDVSKSPTPDKLCFCIAKFLELSLIPVGSFENSDREKIMLVRKWIKRHYLNYL